MFLAKVCEAAAFTGRIEMLTAGTSQAVLLSVEKKQHMLLRDCIPVARFLGRGVCCRKPIH